MRLPFPSSHPPQVRSICESIDEKDAGANCAVALHAAASQRLSGAGPRLRFQVGRRRKGMGATAGRGLG